MEDAAIYYANILMPFGSRIRKYVELLHKLNIPIDMIAPSHGIIWRSHPDKIINAYVNWHPGKQFQKCL